MIYLASSWRNIYYKNIVLDFHKHGIQIYDFQNPSEGAFDWSEVDSEWSNKQGIRKLYSSRELIDLNNHPKARRGYQLDFKALHSSNAGILILPCGKSAHLELGYLIGNKRPTAIYIPDPTEPELMYNMADFQTDNFLELISWAKSHDV